MTTILLVRALGQALYVTHIARTHMIPHVFALVHPKTGTPINATLLVAFPSALVAFFSGLDVLASLLSVSVLFIFTMMPMALLVRRYYVREITPRADLLNYHLSLNRCCFFNGYFGLLGNQAQGIMDQIYNNRSFLVLGDSFLCSSAKSSESVGCTISPVAPLLI